MPLFTSGASNSILCFPVILLSHASNNGSAALSVVRRVPVAASRLSGVKLTRPEAVDAARVPRNQRLYMVRHLSGEHETARRIRAEVSQSAIHSLYTCCGA